MLLLFGCKCENANQAASDFNDINNAEQSQINMFDGKSLGQWEISDFYKPGKVQVKDGSIYIEKSINGGFMQGINWTGPLVTMNYEITLDAMRVEGEDFFCGLTFPVGESPCTLILGGWGGTLCGLSSLDNYDASENETTTFRDFESNQWYKVRLRVTPNRIQAWLDEEPLVDVDTTDKFIDIRIECLPCLPLGIATYQTTSAIRNIKLQKIDEQTDLDLNIED
ncbi:MAG: DUF1080 domain-containing protein [Sedimentisphaerales bacterium]|nr:DUF1080 domain-containing protein [Sedimentisphaerales bacterium]